MSTEETPEILRLQNGSIDYRHYEACGMQARNEEIKIALVKLLKIDRTRTRAFPAFVTIILLVILL
jgi:hypothetical protein